MREEEIPATTEFQFVLDFFSMEGERIVVETEFAKENDSFCVFSLYLGTREKFLTIHGSWRVETWCMCNANLSREPRGGRAV